MGADETVRPEAGKEPDGARKPEAAIRVTATVVEELPSAVYRVALADGQAVLAHAVGMVKRNFVRLLPGDRVQVEVSPHDSTRGRITRRLTGTNDESTRIRKEDLR